MQYSKWMMNTHGLGYPVIKNTPNFALLSVQILTKLNLIIRYLRQRQVSVSQTLSSPFILSTVVITNGNVEQLSYIASYFSYLCNII